jgi:hypothetical protein
MAKQVSDDHRIARVYVSEVYREAGFTVGASSWHGNGYWLPVKGHGLGAPIIGLRAHHGLSVDMRFTEEGGKLKIFSREIQLADPDKTAILDATICHLFDKPLNELVRTMREAIHSQIKTYIQIPDIPLENPSLDTMRNTLSASMTDVIKNLVEVRGNLYTETEETLRFIHLYKTRDSKMSWSDKLRIYLEDWTNSEPKPAAS